MVVIGLHLLTPVAPNVCRWTRINYCPIIRTGFRLPSYMLYYALKIAVRWSTTTQQKFMRNSLEVDNEILRTVASRIKQGVALTEDQEKLNRETREFLRTEDNNGWSSLRTNDTDVKMEVKYAKEGRNR